MNSSFLVSLVVGLLMALAGYLYGYDSAIKHGFQNGWDLAVEQCMTNIGNCKKSTE